MEKRVFLDVWLVVTIWLSLLKRVDSCGDVKMLPHQWIKQVFHAEQLVESPQKLQYLLLVRDLPTANQEFSYIEISKNKKQSITIPTNFMNSDHGIEYCRSNKYVRVLLFPHSTVFRKYSTEWKVQQCLDHML